MEFISIDNLRAVPQQAVTTVTNIHDIESYLIKKQQESGVSFLKAIDIPASEREIAMADLQFMGITSGSMFTSIHGVSEELRERNFKMQQFQYERGVNKKRESLLVPTNKTIALLLSIR